MRGVKLYDCNLDKCLAAGNFLDILFHRWRKINTTREGTQQNFLTFEVLNNYTREQIAFAAHVFRRENIHGRTHAPIHPICRCVDSVVLDPLEAF